MSEQATLARASTSATDFDPTTVKFGTDGWRAIIGKDFTAESLARVVEAAARIFKEDNPVVAAEGAQTLIVGYDCRECAAQYASLAGIILASHGFNVIISHSYCPTPALCWSVANEPEAVGGLMLTSSHNPAEYLGVKLRMPDGGASPKAFSDRVEAALEAALPASFDDALAFAESAFDADQITRAEETSYSVEFDDIITPYIDELKGLVDQKAIAAAGLRVVVDPMYGAGRGYLAKLLRDVGAEVVEINNAADPTFAGLHPEPILPWIQDGLNKVAELGYDACFITDGDADRIGAGRRNGAFVNPHQILALVCGLLVEDKGQKGRVVRTMSGSNLIKRQCERLDLELTTTPIGFKWIYEEMLKGNVMLGGEESGGIGIPTHVRERDGLLMALLLTELMAKTGKDLGTLVDELFETLGHFDYARIDLSLTQEQKEAFLQDTCAAGFAAEEYQQLFATIGEEVTNVDYRDGIKFEFASDAWLLARPSGTEPLVRVYAEATTPLQLESLLDYGCALVKDASFRLSKGA